VTQPTCVTSLQDEWSGLDRPPEGIIDQLVGVHCLNFTHLDICTYELSVLQSVCNVGGLSSRSATQGVTEHLDIC